MLCAPLFKVIFVLFVLLELLDFSPFLLFSWQADRRGPGGGAWFQRVPVSCDRPAQLSCHLPHLHTGTTVMM